jgi:hypothetical protein
LRELRKPLTQTLKLSFEALAVAHCEPAHVFDQVWRWRRPHLAYMFQAGRHELIKPVGMVDAEDDPVVGFVGVCVDATTLFEVRIVDAAKVLVVKGRWFQSRQAT